jgi:hypothetical protein
LILTLAICGWVWIEGWMVGFVFSAERTGRG